MNHRISFKNLNIGTMFFWNGNEFKKTSLKTAFILEFERVFYFRMNDICYLTKQERMKQIDSIFKQKGI